MGVEEVDEPAGWRCQVGVSEREKLVPVIDGAVGMDRWRRNNIVVFGQDVHTWHGSARAGNIATRMAKIGVMAASGKHHRCRRHRQSLQALPSRIPIHIEHEQARHAPRDNPNIPLLLGKPASESALAGTLFAILSDRPLCEGGLFPSGPEGNNAETSVPIGQSFL
jgi:hypothetical protein